ncbi:hypothetical protein AB6A40_003025 [Gnathostoma spinigerum]|uniref:GB1/RHD3-type G domain-containing protein n=1 Tax=Gnathostoma spinigerum TaxID=75299 RepID=A0ABD6EFY9_9BILA
MSLDPTTSLVQTEFNLRDHDDRRHRAHPIQVIYPSSSQPCGFKLDENALCSMFNHPSVANKKVVVISIAGTLRKGKSFLLNFFLEYLYTLQTAQQKDVLLDWLMDDTQIEGFHWKGGAKRDTIGVYLWGEPILIEAASGETYAVVLMDTQGIFEGESPTDMSLTIFYLSTLLSSMQIYNIADVITEDSLLNLLFFVNYGTLFSTEMNSYAPPLQTLVFLVRDFKLADEYTYGAEGGHSYLESVLNLSTKASHNSSLYTSHPNMIPFSDKRY